LEERRNDKRTHLKRKGTRGPQEIPDCTALKKITVMEIRPEEDNKKDEEVNKKKNQTYAEEH